MNQTQKRIEIITQDWREAGGAIVAAKPQPIVIPGYAPAGVQTAQPNGRLSNYLRFGRQFHQLCRGTFVQRIQTGYWAYERREEWQTCALAAAYVGCFGPREIERPEFSYTMAVWRLSQRVGFDIGKHYVTGPTGRHNTVADEMIRLVDENFWTRTGVAEWLASMGM